jgi:hypothetical protein
VNRGYTPAKLEKVGLSIEGETPEDEAPAEPLRSLAPRNTARREARPYPNEALPEAFSRKEAGYAGYMLRFVINTGLHNKTLPP